MDLAKARSGDVELKIYKVGSLRSWMMYLPPLDMNCQEKYQLALADNNLSLLTDIASAVHSCVEQLEEADMIHNVERDVPDA